LVIAACPQLGLPQLPATRASFTLRALFVLGYHEETEAFCQWILHGTCPT